MATPQARVGAIRSAVAAWWRKPYLMATTESKVGRYAPAPVGALLPKVNQALSKLDGFKRPLSISEWGSITAQSPIKDVYVLSANCF
jgi:hypothetical protein